MKQPRWKINKNKTEFYPMLVRSEVNFDDCELFMIVYNQYQKGKGLVRACIASVTKYWNFIENGFLDSIPEEDTLVYIGEKTERVTVKIPKKRNYENRFEFLADMLFINGIEGYRPHMEVMQL